MNNFYDRKLLLALPAIQDPPFYRSVIFLIQHDKNGAFGFILNRPSKIKIKEVLPDWVNHSKDSPLGFIGGPVSTEIPFGLALTKKSSINRSVNSEKDSIRVLDLEQYPTLDFGITNLRIFFGYSSWSPGQLEDEIAMGSWLMLEAKDEDLFSFEPEKLWTKVLERQKSSIAILSDFPSNPSLN